MAGAAVFRDHQLRLTLPCAGSGEAVRAHYREHPEVTGVPRYLDAATGRSG